MGEMVEFPSNGGTRGGYWRRRRRAPARAWSSSRSGGGWSTTSATCATASPPRASPPWRPTSTTARRATEPDEAGKLMMALNVERAAKDMAAPSTSSRATTRSAATASAWSGSAWAAGWPCGWPRCGPTPCGLSCPSTASSRGTPSPTGRSSRPPVERPLRRATTTCTPRGGPRRWRPSSTDLGKEVGSSRYPGTDHAFFNDTRPEVYDADSGRGGLGPHAGVPARQARLTTDSGDGYGQHPRCERVPPQFSLCLKTAQNEAMPTTATQFDVQSFEGRRVMWPSPTDR